MTTSNDTPSAPARVKLPMAMLLLVVMLGTMLGFAGGGAGFYFLAKSGKLQVAQLLVAGDGTKQMPTHQVVMEPILVNLADEGGHAYLRLGLTLEVADGAETVVPTSDAGAPKEGSEAKGGAAPATAKDGGGSQSVVRDTVLAVLGRQNSATLLGPDGKEHLKIELREAIQKSAPQLNLKDLFLTEFLVQV